MAEASADVRERYGWPLKTADPQGFVGSNPTPSAKTALERHGFELASVADDWVHQCGPRVGHRSRIRARAMGSLRCTRFHTEVMNICSWPCTFGPSARPLPPVSATGWPTQARKLYDTRARRCSTLGRVVPMSRVLVTGMSGTGKSSALAELGRRGYRVIDTGDPGWREYREHVESSDELHRGEWLWVEERITGLLDSDGGRSLFVEGCVRNQSKFYHRFNAVVLLSAPADVILDRVTRRTRNNYGKTPLERAMILDDLAKVEPLLREGCTHELDASRPLADTVADLIAIASRPMTTS